VVGHSMGGLVSRGAIARLSTAGKSAGPAVLGLFTLASPHLGTFVADIGEGAMSQSVCGSEPLCLAVTSGVVATSSSYEPALSQLTRAFLVGDTGSTGWNERSGRVPRSIPVTTYAGQSETVPRNDDPYVSPNDAYVGLQSALPGSLKADGVLPSLRCAPATDDTHSRFTRTLAESLLGATPLPIIADPNVARSIVSAIRGHPPRSVC